MAVFVYHEGVLLFSYLAAFSSIGAIPVHSGAVLGRKEAVTHAIAPGACVARLGFRVHGLKLTDVLWHQSVRVTFRGTWATAVILWVLFGVFSIPRRFVCLFVFLHAHGSSVGFVFPLFAVDFWCGVNLCLNSWGLGWGRLAVSGADLGQALAAVRSRGSGLGFEFRGDGCLWIQVSSTFCQV